MADLMARMAEIAVSRSDADVQCVTCNAAGFDPNGSTLPGVGTDRAFVLEGGGMLRDVQLAYETWGELSPTGDNAILVCHALTGDSQSAVRLGATYDPDFIARAHVPVRGDAAAAAYWYAYGGITRK